jgi:hypothetical protein
MGEPTPIYGMAGYVPTTAPHTAPTRMRAERDSIGRARSVRMRITPEKRKTLRRPDWLMPTRRDHREWLERIRQLDARGMVRATRAFTTTLDGEVWVVAEGERFAFDHPLVQARPSGWDLAPSLGRRRRPGENRGQGYEERLTAAPVAVADNGTRPGRAPVVAHYEIADGLGLCGAPLRGLPAPDHCPRCERCVALLDAKAA